MKIIHGIPPLVALIIAASWLTPLRRSTDAVSQENAVMRERLASPGKSSFSRENRNEARSKSVRADVRPKRERKTPDNVDNPSGDWVNTSRDWIRLVLSNNDEPATRYRYTAAWKRLETLASEMSGEEITRAYTEMSGLPVHAPFRNDLEWIMLKELERKNPAVAFSQYIAKYQIGDRVPARIGAFNEWLARDPTAATTWYESQLSAGAFDKSLDGKSRAIVPFESAFIMSLLASNPTAAEQRMNDISPELRASMGSYMWKVPEESGKAFIDLLRKTMPMEEYMAVLRNNSLTDYNFSLSIDNDPESVQRNLDGLGVTQEERSTLLAQQFADLANYSAMRAGGDAPSREKFDSYRKWIEAIDPAAADRATGVALQSYVEKSKTSGALDFIEKYASDYHAAGGGDELLIPLIEGSARGSAFPKERARALANRITDAKLRNELLEKLN